MSEREPFETWLHTVDAEAQAGGVGFVCRPMSEKLSDSLGEAYWRELYQRGLSPQEALIEAQEEDWFSVDSINEFMAAVYLVARKGVPNRPDERDEITLTEWVQEQATPDEFAEAQKIMQSVTPEERGAIMEEAGYGDDDAPPLH